eukprot:CAMPEP_0204576952 /NCGR_PEP_ID=MMETSP0661-20131031/42072_1 /ASSEMBLY_ACC=CAM_ASM_000606 /TAXON_ID=109239 /ORGANISM="Alexandrium margalefi, Strain AMGDE01CS-322" /LENGTH=156 /DNA_ID=CAMNT_0051585751 /DNA_START=136 /DNA_END=604 /DNA_ORIENTATION=+
MVLLQVGHAVLSKMQDKAARQDAIAAVVSQLRGFPGGMGTVIVLVMVTIGLTYFFLAFMSEPMEDTCPEVSLEDKLRLQQADHFTKELLKHKEQSEDVPNNAQTGASSSCNASPAASVILEDADDRPGLNAGLSFLQQGGLGTAADKSESRWIGPT